MRHRRWIVYHNIYVIRGIIKKRSRFRHVVVGFDLMIFCVSIHGRHLIIYYSPKPCINRPNSIKKWMGSCAFNLCLMTYPNTVSI